MRELSSTVFFIVAEILQHVQVAFFDEPVVELRGGYARRGPKISQRPANHWVGTGITLVYRLKKCFAIPTLRKTMIACRRFWYA